MRLIVFLLAIALPGLALAQMPGPIQQMTDESFQACREGGGNPSLVSGFLTQAELNGDGQPDYVTDLALLDCEGAASYFCGSAGCPVTVWLSGPQGLFAAWGSHAQAWEVKDGRFVAYLHGAFCDPPRVGVDGCEETIAFAGVTAPAAQATQAASSPAAAAPVAGRWELREAAGAPAVAVSPGVGNLQSLAGFCLNGHPLIIGVFETKPEATKVNFEFRFPGRALTVPAETGEGTGGTYVMDAGASGLAAALSGNASEVPVRVDGTDYGILTLAGSTRALRAALSPCLRF